MKVQMKICFLTLAIITSLAMTPREAHAQYEIAIHGVPISCTADGGKRVPLIISDQARKWGGGYARNDPVKGPSLMLSPAYLNTLPRLAAFNLFYHECAHLALPMGVGLQNPEKESNADCYAVKEMRKHGLISSMEEFKEATAYLRTLKATGEGHRPGPERVKRAARCAKVPVVKTGDSYCRNLDKIFAGGKSYLARFDFENKTLFPGLFPIGWCYHDNGSLICSREFAREKKAVSFANRLANKVRNCLPSNFKYEKSGGPGEWLATGHDWTNAETGHEISVGSLYSGEFDFALRLPKSELAGKWKVTDTAGTPFEIALDDDGSATANRSGEGMEGTWKEENGAAIISWKSGWITKVAKGVEGDVYMKTAWDKGLSMNDRPTNTSRAEKVN